MVGLAVLAASLTLSTIWLLRGGLDYIKKNENKM